MQRPGRPGPWDACTLAHRAQAAPTCGTRTVTTMLIRNATLPDGRTGQDLLIQGDRIAAVGPSITPPEGTPVVEADGLLVTPPFVDAHFHLDSTLSAGMPRHNVSGTLLEGIALWGELKPLLTAEALAERALEYCDWAVSQGIGAIRTHVDICDERLLAVQALLEVKKRVAPYLDLQLVAFPQDGLLRSPGALAVAPSIRGAAGVGRTA